MFKGIEPVLRPFFGRKVAAQEVIEPLFQFPLESSQMPRVHFRPLTVIGLPDMVGIEELLSLPTGFANGASRFQIAIMHMSEDLGIPFPSRDESA
jgi:hypothetical protein